MRFIGGFCAIYFFIAGAYGLALLMQPAAPLPAEVAPPVVAIDPGLRPSFTEERPARVTELAVAPPQIALPPEARALRGVPRPSAVPSKRARAKAFSSPPRPARREAERIEKRLYHQLEPELLTHFDLFIYVNKAARGPGSQHMYVFGTDEDLSGFVLFHAWPVSTGRERREYAPSGNRVRTITPLGIYQLDPKRFYRRYRSRAWRSDMPYSMFFDYEKHGALSGIAIHAANGRAVGRLGTRASAGCIRLGPANARALFEMIQADYGGLIPKLAYDAETRTTDSSGALMRDASGALQFAEGYRVLVIVDDFAGEEPAAQPTA